MTDRIDFASRIDARLVDAVRDLAETAGTPIQSLVEEALGDLLVKHAQSAASANVLAHHRESMMVFAPLYERLAR